LAAGPPRRQSLGSSPVGGASHLPGTFTARTGGQARQHHPGRTSEAGSVCETNPILWKIRLCQFEVMSFAYWGHRAILSDVARSHRRLVRECESPSRVAGWSLASVRSHRGLHWRTSRHWHPEGPSGAGPVCETNPISRTIRLCQFEVMSIVHLGHRSSFCGLAGRAQFAFGGAPLLRQARTLYGH
jgi:hypothetical protein